MADSSCWAPRRGAWGRGTATSWGLRKTWRASHQSCAAALMGLGLCPLPALGPGLRLRGLPASAAWADGVLTVS